MGSDGRSGGGESGFALVGLVVAIFLILLALSVAAPRVARSLRRDRELETERRAQQYVRGIRMYYKKFGHYPASMEQLEKSNEIRFLRQRYVDPMTGKDDWRLIHIGEQKTTTKGFFGQPLAGIASAGLGSLAGSASPGGTGVPAGSIGVGGATTGTGLGSGSSLGLGSGGIGAGAAGTGGLGATTGGDAGASGTAATTASGNNSTASGGAFGAGFGSNPGSSSSSDSSGSGGPFLGVGVPKDGESIMTVNEKTAYNEWEFWYDPRIEQLLGKSNLLGGGPAASGGLGALSGSQSTFGGGLSNGVSGAAGAGTTTPPAGSNGGNTGGTTPPQ